MNTKAFIWLGVTIGSFLGGCIPLIWGASALSVSSVIFSTIGGAFGIYAGYKMSRY